MDKKIKNIYFIGITGVGMSALASLCQQMGYNVSGSDVDEQFITDKLLLEEGIQRFFGFNQENLKKFNPDLVIVGASFGQTNEEFSYSQKKKYKTVYYSEAITIFTKNMHTIAVAGVHGKTTITAFMAYMFESLQFSPSYLIGSAHIPGLKSNAQLGTGKWFIMEADEYKKAPDDNSPKLTDIRPQIAVITSIEWDHPDIYPTLEAVYDTFYKFACSVERNGLLIVNYDNVKIKKLIHSLADRHFISYGFESGADWQIYSWKEDEYKNEFQIKIDNTIHGPFTISLSGKHNVYNALAVMIACYSAGAKLETIQKYLNNFKGVERRFQFKGEKEGIIYLDDYAHHPTAITTTLQAVKAKYPKRRIICIFQPHTFSRTKALLNDFAKAFTDADKVIIMDIYASAREKSGGIHAKHLVFEIKKHHKDVLYLASSKEVHQYLNENTQDNDLVLTVGAGDVYKIIDDIL